jgi:hypothetical protein
LRLKVQSKRHNAAYFDDVIERLDTIEGVRAHVTPAAASVLINYSGPVAALLEKLIDVGLADLLEVEFPTPVAEAAEAIIPSPLKLALLVGLLVFGWQNGSFGDL